MKTLLSTIYLYKYAFEKNVLDVLYHLQKRERKPFSWQSGKLLQRFPITFIEAFLGAPPDLDFHVE